MGLKPPIGKVLRKPTGSSLGSKGTNRGRVDYGNGKLGLNSIEYASHGIWMDFGRYCELLESGLDILKGRLNKYRFPFEFC